MAGEEGGAVGGERDGFCSAGAGRGGEAVDWAEVREVINREVGFSGEIEEEGGCRGGECGGGHVRRGVSDGGEAEEGGGEDRGGVNRGD